MKYTTFLFFVFLVTETFSQVTNIVILDKSESFRLQKIVLSNPDVRLLYDSIVNEAEMALARQPLPLIKMHYEGLLDTDSRRIQTVKSFDDINAAATLIYADYGANHPKYSKKLKQFILAWANTFKPDGNPINENKLTVFLWGYYLYKNDFTQDEQRIVESWIYNIASGLMDLKNTPNNNWEAKRLRIIGLAGGILKNKQMKEFSIDGFKKYISTAYFPDGTSNDLNTRDALHYHISGIKPCLSAFINLSKFDERFDLFDWESKNSSSIRKAVEFTLPYARGEKQRREWANSKVIIDKQRAQAGLEMYQPGILFDPKNAWELFEWACYFNREWYNVIENPAKSEYTSGWIGLLNSPLVREK